MPPRWRHETAYSPPAIGETRQSGLVTGDAHQSWAGELKKNFSDEKFATLGVDFVTAFGRMSTRKSFVLESGMSGLVDK
jgi:hypothetical protein